MPSNMVINNRTASTLLVGGVYAEGAYYGSSEVFIASEGDFNPASLFANGEQGAFYDPSDLSTLFQDDAGTTPVTGPGQTVGLMLDKSGNGSHATQSTAESRPVYQAGGGLQWLEFDGVDDFLAVDITARYENTTIVAGANAVSTTSNICYIIGQRPAESERFYFNTTVVSKGGVQQFYDGVIDRAVYFARYDDPEFLMRRDGAIVASGEASITGDIDVRLIGAGTVDPGGSQILPTVFFDGEIYGLLLRVGPNLSAEDRDRVESFFAQRTGVTL